MCKMEKKEIWTNFFVNRCMFVGHAQNKPKKNSNEKLQTKKHLETWNEWNLKENKTYLTIGIAIWKSFQLSHIYTKQKKGGSTNLKS
jgi:hypothetical protein